MRTIDVGVRDVVALLNAIPGVATRASCEGAGRARSTPRHADLAYVLWRYPIPLVLQDFLLARIDAVARIEPDGLYSRWPADNREFLSRLAAAARAYPGTHHNMGHHLRVPLAKLRARLARRLTQREPTQIILCRTCNDVVLEPHVATHQTVLLLQVPEDQAAQWFAEFVARSDNRLDPQLIDHEGLEHVVARTHRGDFGAAFYRRWLRYRSSRLADLTTHQLRLSVEALRRDDGRIDFYFDGAHAHVTWADGPLPS